MWGVNTLNLRLSTPRTGSSQSTEGVCIHGGSSGNSESAELWVILVAVHMYFPGGGEGSLPHSKARCEVGLELSKYLLFIHGIMLEQNVSRARLLARLA